MPVDDNGFMLLKTAKNQTAFLHVSCTEWKNLFSFEIYGKNAKLHLEDGAVMAWKNYHFTKCCLRWDRRHHRLGISARR